MNSSNTSTIHFKTSNSVANATGFNGQPFYGDCIRYDLGPDTNNLDFRVVQFDTSGTVFQFYLYSGAFSGPSIVEIAGGTYGLVPNHTFAWDLRYNVVIPSYANYITATKSVIYSSTSPPSLAQVVGGSTLFNKVNGIYAFNPTAIAQSVSSAVQSGPSAILRPVATSSGS